MNFTYNSKNGDDANATKMKFVLDTRTIKFRDSKEKTLGLEDFAGPSLLVFNDAIFTSEDFESIQSIGESLKVEDKSKTGRFGLGFNSVYVL